MKYDEQQRPGIAWALFWMVMVVCVAMFVGTWLGISSN